MPRKIADDRTVANFPASELERLLERLFAAAESYEKCPTDLVDIHFAAKSLGSIATIVSLVLEGDLKRLGRLVTRRGIPALLVDPDEMREPTPVYDGTGFSRAELAELLGVTTMTISYLIDQRLLSVETSAPIRRGRALDVITQSSVERFLDEFITLTCLARLLNRAPGPLCQHLTAKGVVPTPVPNGMNRIYRRADVDESGIL